MAIPPLPEERLCMVDWLRKKLVYHEARVGILKEAITTLEANPKLEGIYTLLRDAKS
jgi:hypothetical protein